MNMKGLAGRVYNLLRGPPLSQSVSLPSLISVGSVFLDPRLQSAQPLSRPPLYTHPATHPRGADSERDAVSRPADGDAARRIRADPDGRAGSAHRSADRQSSINWNADTYAHHDTDAYTHCPFWLPDNRAAHDYRCASDRRPARSEPAERRDCDGTSLLHRRPRAVYVRRREPAQARQSL